MDPEGFDLAIFPLDANDQLKDPIAAVSAASTRGGSKMLDAPVTLSPTQYYFLAQGRHSGTGSCYRVDNFNVGDLIATTVISEWGPSDGRNSYRITANNGKAQDMVGESISITDASKPDLGFLHHHTNGFLLTDFGDEQPASSHFWRG